MASVVHCTLKPSQLRRGPGSVCKTRATYCPTMRRAESGGIRILTYEIFLAKLLEPDTV